MRREAVLVAGAAVVLAITLSAAILVPAESPSPEAADGELHFEEMTITATEVSGSTAELGLDARLAQFGAPAENVSVELRAIDSETGIREDREVLQVESVEGEQELRLTGSLTVDRSSSYDLQAVVYEDGRRVAIGRSSISGLQSLQPDYADAPVEFHRFSRAPLPSVEYQILNAGDGEVTLRTSAYLTNVGTGDEPSLEVELLARETQSNVIADRERVDVGSLEPGQTATPTATLDVPDDYNYYLDAIVYDDGVVVDTAREPATLDPGTEAPDNQSSDGGDDGDALDTDPFEIDEEEQAMDDGADDATDDAAMDDGSGDDSQPGFGIGAAIVALLAGVAALARYRA